MNHIFITDQIEKNKLNIDHCPTGVMMLTVSLNLSNVNCLRNFVANSVSGDKKSKMKKGFQICVPHLKDEISQVHSADIG